MRIPFVQIDRVATDQPVTDPNLEGSFGELFGKGPVVIVRAAGDYHRATSLQLSEKRLRESDHARRHVG